MNSNHNKISRKVIFMKRYAVTLILSFILSSVSFADIYYVSNAGSNENNGLSTDKPLKTLAKAAEMVSR